MFMEKVGNLVTNKPGAAIAAVLIVTLLLFSGVFVKGLDQTFDESSFMPDIPMAQAESEVGNNFAREYSITILVKGTNGNILTPEALVEMLEVEKALAEDPFLAKNLEQPTVPAGNFNSVADQIVFIALLQEQIAGMYTSLDLMNTSVGLMNMGFQYLTQPAATINTSDVNATMGTLMYIDDAVQKNLTVVQKFVSNWQAQMGGGQGTASSMVIPFDQKIAMISAMSQPELDSLIQSAIAYDGSTTYAIRTLEIPIQNNLQAFIDTSSAIAAQLDRLISDPNITNATLYGTDGLDYIENILSNSMNLKKNLSTLSIGLESMDITNATLKLDSTFAFLGFGLGYLLTSDFQPASGSFVAKGTIILVYFNASIGESGTTGHSSNVDQLEIEKKMDDIARDYNSKEAEFSVIGNNLITEEIMGANNQSLMFLILMAIIFVIIILFAIYRNFFDMGISFSALGLGILWMYGAGAWLGFTFNPITTMVPILIVGLGIDYSIHLIMRYKEELLDNQDIRKSMAIAITWVGTALLLATITTMVAFLSNMSSPMTLLFEFGILAAIGILGCFVSMVVFLTAAKQLRDGRRARKGKLKYLAKNSKSKEACKEESFSQNLFCRGIASGATIAAKAPGAVIVVTILITLASFYGAYNLETKFDFEDFLPDDLDITKDINFLMEEFSTGSLVSEEIVVILVNGDIAEPSVVSDIGRTISNMADDTYVNMKTTIPYGGNNGNNGNGNLSVYVPDVDSILSLMQDYAMGTSYNETFSSLYYNAFDISGNLRQTTTRNQIETMFDWLHKNAEKDTKFLLHYNEDNDRYDSTVLRISVTTDMEDEKSFKTLEELDDDKNPLEENSNVDDSIVTGGPILFSTIMSILNESQMRSLIITVIACGIILTFVFWFEKRSLSLGVITTFPVVLVISWSMGVMYILDIPLNIMTITIASLTVGLGVTYGIHITHRFLENVEKYPTIDEAGHNTVISTGIALFGAAATTIAAFGMLIFSLLPPMQQFGGISALTIFFSFISCVFILPTFLRIWAIFREKQGTLRTEKTKRMKYKTPDFDELEDVKKSVDETETTAETPKIEGRKKSETKSKTKTKSRSKTKSKSKKKD